MFDFAWSEIALIAGVALVVIGPKDLPVAIKAISGFIRKARRMASEFQTHVDEMVRDADLKDVRESFNSIRNFDLKSTVERAIDPDRALRDTFSANPLDPTVGGTSYASATETSATEASAMGESPPEPPPPARVPAPDFMPPAFVPYADAPEPPPPPPPFIPPLAVLQRPPA